MTRDEFIRQLESLLQGISSAEREEALQYYNDYFDDAGPENEEDVIEALGNPTKVAENIKRDLLTNGYGDEPFVQATAGDRAVIAYREECAENNVADDVEGNATEGSAWDGTAVVVSDGDAIDAEPDTYKKKDTTGSKYSTGLIILIVVICLLSAPAVFGITSGILGTLIGLVIGWFGFILGFGIAAIALLLVFVVLAVVAALCLATDPLVSVALLGGGLICAGIGILFMMLTVALAGIVTPAICSGISALIRKVFGRKKAV